MVEEEEEKKMNTMTSENRRRESSSSSCPFAMSLEEDEEGSQQQQLQITTATTMEEVVQVARKSCPAFSDMKKCPFSTATNASEIRETFEQIPSSHFSSTTSNMLYFQKALLLFQQQSSSSSSNSISFVEVMEEFSSAGIMSQMAQKIQNAENDESIRTTTTTAAAAAAVSPSLSEAFKKGTSEAHEAAENVHFVKNFIAGDIDRELYADLILSLHSIYTAMEHLLDKHHADAAFSTCHFPNELSRTDALREDVDFWHGSSPPSVMSPATLDYVRRLNKIANETPLLLLAHAYTRYLGDLSGGKILARVARRAMKLDKSGDGLAFYQFTNIDSERAFKDVYRQQLDQLKLEPSQIQALVQEANVAFLLNMRIFEELDVKSNIPGAVVRPLAEVWSFSSNKTNTSSASNDATKEEECPFLARKKKQQQNTTANNTTVMKKEGRCPWPFVFFHDPMAGLQDYKTWIVIGLLGTWIWSSYVQ